MGLDTTIYFRANAEFTEDKLEHYLPVGFTVVPMPRYDLAMYPYATHELHTGHRYYGEGYPRGPWPHICAALMILFATESVERVWYGSDCSGPEEIRPADIIRISLYYMGNGRGCYRTPPAK